MMFKNYFQHEFINTKIDFLHPQKILVRYRLQAMLVVVYGPYSNTL